MPSYRTKPERVEAVQFNPRRLPWPDYVEESTEIGPYVKDRWGMWNPVTPGQWIVTYEDGRREVFDDAAFRDRFEEVSE